MLNMVPAAVHVALKERYSQVLVELNRVTSVIHSERKKVRKQKMKERPPDDWRHYVEEDKLKSDMAERFEAMLGQEGVEPVSDDSDVIPLSCFLFFASFFWLQQSLKP